MGRPRSPTCGSAAWRSWVALGLGVFLFGLAVELVAVCAVLFVLDHL